MKKWQIKANKRREAEITKKRKGGVIKKMIFMLVVVLALFGSLVLLTRGKSQPSSQAQTQESVPANNVSMVDGKQIIQVAAKGGYFPKKSLAKAGIPTILRFNTNGTFDCSSAVRIPTMKLSKNLPATGTTDIDLGTQQQGQLAGICSMGMYSFEVNFQS